MAASRKLMIINFIWHKRPRARPDKARHPQADGLRERLPKTILDEFPQAAFRREICPSLEELQDDLDAWLKFYHNERARQGLSRNRCRPECLSFTIMNVPARAKMGCGRTPPQIMIDGKRRLGPEKVEALNRSDDQTLKRGTL